MEEHKFLNFFSKHWSKLLLGFLAIASIAAWGERFFSSNRSQSQQDFVVAGQILERFQNGETLPIESIETTELILKRHPELHPKYDMMLAMTYLAHANPSKGLPYTKASVGNANQDLPAFYKTYANTSHLIAEKRYKEAYSQAQALDVQLKNDDAHSTLYALNLLRQVSLEMEIGSRSEAWEQLKAHPAFPSIATLFQEGSLLLEDWHSLRLNN